MQAFLIKMSLITVGVVGIHLIAAWQADGTTDPYYWRFATPKQHSLIIGTSRAAQGLLPAYFDFLSDGTQLEGPMYNFAFTALHSPYGPKYLRAISHKIHPTTKAGLFILTVDPWSLSTLKNTNDDAAFFRENQSPIGNLRCYSCRPNFDYLLNHYEYNWGRILWEKFFQRQMIVKNNGWLQVDIPMDSASIMRRTNEKMQDYRRRQLPKYDPSSQRMYYLERTIRYLQAYGTVLLVRMPVSSEMLAIEAQLMPTFDEKMGQLAVRHHIPYYNFTDASDAYVYTDGNHLAERSGQKFSRELARKIEDYLAQTFHDERIQK